MQERACARGYFYFIPPALCHTNSAHQGFTELQQKLADTEEKLKSERELFEKEIVDLAAERDAHEAELRRSAESERSLRLQVP